MSGDSGKWLAVVVILVFSGLLWLQQDVFQDEVAGRARVVDGDSLELKGERIRLKGIDAPELAQKCRKNGAEWACGRASLTALRKKIASHAVDCKGGEFDRHERLLAYCSAGGTELNRWMVAEGWAVSYGGNFKTEERAAKSAKRGVWQGEFTMPQAWRRQNPRY